MTTALQTLTGAVAGVARTAYKLAFTCSPIILTGGVAANLSGGKLPIIALTEYSNAVLSITSALTSLMSSEVSGRSLDNVLCQFDIIPGGTPVAQTIGTYPFANQQAAANATVMQPKKLALKMSVNPNTSLGILSVAATLNALWATLEKHNNSGGTYTILTPNFIAKNWLMTPGVTDITPSPTAAELRQSVWQFSFEKPVLTEEEASSTQNSVMSKLTDGTSFGSSDTLSWSSLIPTVSSTSNVISLVKTLVGAV